MVLGLLTVRFADESAGFLPAGAFASFRDDLGLTYAQASAVLVAAAPGAMAGTGFAVLADRHSRRAIAAGGAAGFAAALAAFGLAPSWWILLGASFLLGCNATAMVDAADIALVDAAGADAPAAISRSHLFGAAGDLCGPAALVVAAGTGFGWRAAFLVFAAAMTGYAAWLATLPLPAPHPSARATSVRDGLLAVVRDRRVWFYGALAMLLAPLDEPFVAFLIAHLERNRGLTTTTATAVALAWVLGTIVALAATSRTGYRPRATTLARAAALVFTSATACVVLPWPAAAAAAAATLGFGVARFFVALVTRILALRPGQLGTVKAVVTNVELAGFGLPLAAGRVADVHGVAVGLGCYTAVAGLLCALAATATWRRGTTRPANPDQASSSRAI